MQDVFLLIIFPPISHRMLDIGVMSRGDSFPSSSIAPASSTPPCISSHMPCNPETHVILRLNPFGKEMPYRRRGSCNHLIAVKSSIEILDSPSQHIPFAFQLGRRDHIARSTFSRPNWTIVPSFSSFSKLQLVMFRTPQYS
jgi:hypothetical protein